MEKGAFASTSEDAWSQISVCKEQGSRGRNPPCMNEHMFSGYVKSLSVKQRCQYFAKLRLKNPCLDLPDPYKIVGWVSNTKKWPDLNKSHVHQYLLQRQQTQTESETTACASLKGYSAFNLGNVQGVEHASVSIVFPVCFLKAIVVSPYQTGIEACLAWVCLEKTDGTIKASHCTCLKQFEGVCCHIAGLLFKVEAAVSLGINKEDSDRSSSSSNSRLTVKNKCGRSRLCVARVKDTYFTHQNSNKGLRQPLKDLKLQPLPKAEQKKALARLRKIVPNASLFPKEESDTDTASEGEWDREKASSSVHHPPIASENEGEKEQFSADEREQLSQDEKEQTSPSLYHHPHIASDDEVNSVVSALDFEGFDSDEQESGHGAATPQQ